MAEISTLNGYKIKDKKAIRFYSTVADMIADTTLKENMHVKTSGYYSANDGGGAEYKITNTQSNSEYQEELNNNLYANLIIENNILNIKQIGAKGDGTTDDTQAIKNILVASDNIYFPQGEYLLNDIITIEDKTIIGENPNTTKIIEKNYITVREGVIDIKGCNIIKNITLEKSFSDTENPETKLCQIKNCYNSLFDNVYFISNGYLTGATIDLFHNNQNITFQNCKSILKSIDSNNNNARGGVWIRESIDGYVSSNIIFDNCYFENTSLDEAVAVWNWNGTVKDVTFTNCYIYGTSENTAPHFTRLECENLKVNNCTFINLGVNTSIGENKIGSMVKSGSDSQKTFFNNCIFKVNATLANGYSTNALAYFNNCYFENTLRASLGKGTYNNCEIICAECYLAQAICYDTHFKFTNSTGESLTQYSVELYNCIFDGLNYDNNQTLFQIFASDVKFIMKNVQFNGNLLFKWFISLPDEVNVSKFEIENTLVGDIYRESRISSGYMINCPCIKSPQTLTNVKTNNIFNINL